MIDHDLPADPRGLERPEGDPEGVLNLWAEHKRWTGRQCEYKWSYDDWGKHRRSRMQVVQDAEALSSCEVDTDFLEGFSNRGHQEIGVGKLAAPARECDLARPGVADSHGAVDEQRFDAVVAVVQ